MVNSLSTSTRASYKRSWEHFKSTCKMFDQTLCPASVNSLLIYIAYCSCEGLSYNTVVSRVSAIAFIHRFRCKTDNTQHFLVRKTLMGYKNKFNVCDSRKPLSISLLSSMCNNLHKIFTDRYNICMFRALFLTAFYAFLRIGEYTSKTSGNPNNILRSNVKLHYKNNQLQGFSITFDKFKHSKGRTFTLYISKCSNDLCPVQAMSNYLSLRPTLEGPLFVSRQNSPISSSFFNTIMKSSIIMSLGSSAGYSSHSFRIGAASHCLRKGFTKAKIQEMGRWRTNAVEKYFRVTSFTV